MKTVSVSVVLVSCVAFNGCASSGGPGEDDARIDPASFPTAADFPEPAAGDFNVNVVLVNEAIDSRLMGQAALPQVVFSVWGFDELAADASATNIHEIEVDLRPQSLPYYLRFSESDMSSVEFQSGSPDSLKYYVTMGIDVDGDGIICNGDFRQDYSQSPPKRFPVAQTDVNLEIPVIEISGEICNQ